MIGTALVSTAVNIMQARDVIAPPPTSIASGVATADASADNVPNKTSRWFVRLGVLRALYDSGARIATNGSLIPDSSAGVTDSITINVDGGYDLSDDVAVMFMGGIPPSADVIGRGSIALFGRLGRVRFGPAILSSVYRLPQWHGLRPYGGAGIAHLFILKAHDGSVTQLKVHDNWGFVLQAGLEYRLSRKWELFADYKHIWLNVRAEGFLAGEAVRARVTLDPDLISAGIKFHFG